MNVSAKFASNRFKNNTTAGKKAVLALVASVCFLAACSEESSSSSTAKAKVKLNAIAMSETGSLSTLALGSSKADDLQSLKYMISQIMICEDLTPVGSGFTNTINCSTFYSGNIPTKFRDSTQPVSIEEIAKIQAGEYSDYQIDLMDATSRSKLNKNGALSAGEYKYAIINWASPIQFRATVDAGGTTIYSKPTTSIETNNGFTKSTTNETMTSGPAKDAVIVSSDGGTYFKFAKPFVITEDDITAGNEFVIDLVFNADDVVRGTDDPDSFSMASWLKDEDETGAMYLPLLSLSPVPRLSTDTNSKETYKITDGDGNVYRLELYYNTSDADKAIRGVSMVPLNQNTSDDAKFTSITEDANGKLDFTSTSSSLEGFNRSTTACDAEKVNNISVVDCEFIATTVVE